ncbi:carboxypeptidase-like regulatory domain-containing protein [Leeuwenhoekiella sp. NPDC079379]|uniref:carboxypeptidase-like regulatory domain-containing protein n=1 Tax=Leeuwenhoekiella sp. NPDC079379 TaxID=3364122 RepID=UPI0037CA7DB9
MVRHYTMTVLFSCFLMITGFAQQIEVSGTVLDDQATPLLGVSVQVKGTDKGAITDFDGNYTIEVPQGGTLVFSYVGFETQNLTANGPTLNVTMT